MKDSQNIEADKAGMTMQSHVFCVSRCLLTVCMLWTSTCRVQAEEATRSDSATGTIRGTVRYEADPQRPWRLGRYYIRNAKTGELAEAVVALDRRGLTGPAEQREPATTQIDQRNFQFIPETVAIRAGDQILFLNSDDHVHNVKTSHPKMTFNITMPVGGEHEITFSQASGVRRPYEVGCAFHSAMRAWVFVFAHPWFAMTGKEGTFELKDVPPGEYRLDVVHPAGDLRSSKTIQLVAGQKLNIEITLRPEK